jgi:hypothetical protein
LAEEVGLHDRGVAGVDVERLVEGESGDVPGVVLEHGAGEGFIDGLIAD